MITFISSCFCVIFLFVLIRFIHRVWWTPIRIEKIMASQGIKGPSYKFLHGSTKEIINMKNESTSNVMDLSHHDHIFHRIQPHIYSWIKLYGKNFLYWYGPLAHLVITETELIKEILNNKEGAYPKIKIQGYLKNLLGDGLVVVEGEKWSKRRKMANHAFHSENLKDMVPAMIESVEANLEGWRHHEGKEIDVYQKFRFLTAEVISRTAFGSSYLEGKHIFEMLTKLASIFAKHEYKIRFPGIRKIFKSSDDIEADKAEQSIRYSIIEIIKKREENVMKGEADSFGSDFLGSLIKVHHDPDDNKRISVDDMIDECKTFYIGGQETTHSLLTWCIFLLAIHTDWQDKARKEVLELFGQENPNPEGISRLKMMSCIINETLRLYCPVSSIGRKVDRKVRLGKLILPAEIEIHIPPPALHHNPEIWGQEAHLFKPERFAEGLAKATNNDMMAFLPFGFGPRTCVGLNFATTEAKITLAMILQRYKFTLSPTYVHSPVQILTLHPQHGLQVILQDL